MQTQQVKTTVSQSHLLQTPPTMDDDVEILQEATMAAIIVDKGSKKRLPTEAPEGAPEKKKQRTTPTELVSSAPTPPPPSLPVWYQFYQRVSPYYNVRLECLTHFYNSPSSSSSSKNCPRRVLDIFDIFIPPMPDEKNGEEEENGVWMPAAFKAPYVPYLAHLAALHQRTQHLTPLIEKLLQQLNANSMKERVAHFSRVAAALNAISYSGDPREFKTLTVHAQDVVAAVAALNPANDDSHLHPILTKLLVLSLQHSLVMLQAITLCSSICQLTTLFEAPYHRSIRRFLRDTFFAHPFMTVVPPAYLCSACKATAVLGVGITLCYTCAAEQHLNKQSPKALVDQMLTYFRQRTNLFTMDHIFAFLLTAGGSNLQALFQWPELKGLIPPLYDPYITETKKYTSIVAPNK